MATGGIAINGLRGGRKIKHGMRIINAPLDRESIRTLKAGDQVLLNGVIYTARDQAHSRLVDAIRAGKKLPIELSGQVIYFCGPTKARPGEPIGSCGPTTSRRMDQFSPVLLKAGLSGMIGKGSRSDAVIDAMIKYRGVYFLAYAGCGALIHQYIKSARVAAYADLGPEAIYRLEVQDFPLIVGADSAGRSIYKRLEP
jgi:fumarate hydratase subunit beta